MQRARTALFARGYAKLTMTELADACGLSRRGLYHHFKNKDDIVRAMMRQGNYEAFEAADWAASTLMARGADALDVLAKWLDIRFGETRRLVSRSPHGEEINAAAFRIGHDIMIEVSKETNERLARLIEELSARGRLVLRPGMTAEVAGGLVGDGARGVNQARPPIPPGKLAARYRQITDAVLFGCATAPDKAR